MTTNIPARSVALHIGAHKTATSHLQRSWQSQQEALIAAGVRFYGPESLRRPHKSIADVFGLDFDIEPPQPTRSPADQADFMFKDGHRLVLSDENFVGVLHNKDGNISTPLYPRAGLRIAALSAAIDCGPIDIVIGIREPASFLTSAYGQALMGGKTNSFAEYLDKNPLKQVYWPGLIARIRSTEGVGRVFVSRYEDYKWRFHPICAALMGDSVDMRLRPYPDRVHTGLSAAAVAAILADPDAADPVRQATIARDKFPVGETYPAFTLFSADEHAASVADYTTQMDEIDRIEGVTVLHP